MKKAASFLVRCPLALAIGLLLVFPMLYAFFGAFRSASEFAQYPPRLLPESFANLTNFKKVLVNVLN